MRTFQIKDQSESEHFQIDECFSYLLPRVHATVSNLANRYALGELRVTSTQCSILSKLGGGNIRLASELARECHIDASAATRLIDRLEKRRFVIRERGGGDRRTSRLSLTPEGQALADRVPAIRSLILDRALADFSEDEIRNLGDLLVRVLENSFGLANRLSVCDQ